MKNFFISLHILLDRALNGAMIFLRSWKIKVIFSGLELRMVLTNLIGTQVNLFVYRMILQIIKVSFIIRSMQFLKINLEHFGLVPEGDLINSIGNRGILFMFGMTLIIKTGLPIKIQSFGLILYFKITQGNSG